MKNASFDTFICANSKDGFVTFQEDIMSADNIGIIKGGPGTGKSTFMKKLADKFEQNGVCVERIHCSSDPNSLDGIYVRDKSIVYFDGTAPHTQELPLPGVGCRLIDLGNFWNIEGLRKHRESIRDFNMQIRDLFKRAYGLLCAAGRCDNVCDFLVEPFFNWKRTEKYVVNLSAKLFTEKSSVKGKTERRFFSAISNLGQINYGEKMCNMCDRIYEISDKNEYCAPFILNLLCKNANEKGYNTLQFFNPLNPEKCEFLFIDKINLGIGKKITSEPYLKINTLRFLDSEGIKEYRNRIRFYKKLRDELIKDAVTLLAEAKSRHDDLENIYINEMDFAAVDKFTQSELKEI